MPKMQKVLGQSRFAFRCHRSRLTQERERERERERENKKSTNTEYIRI